MAAGAIDILHRGFLAFLNTRFLCSKNHLRTDVNDIVERLAMAIITWTHNSFHYALTERCVAGSLIVDMLTVSSRTRALDIAPPGF
jgi:hypothetical protein